MIALHLHEDKTVGYDDTTLLPITAHASCYLVSVGHYSLQNHSF